MQLRSTLTSTTILAIETSCDETAVAIVQNGTDVLSAVVHSQIPIHTKYGGVVPEVAARAHVENILPVLSQAVYDAFGEGDVREIIRQKIDFLAVTHGPGLIGSLLVGVSTARTLAAEFNKPLIPVNHILGHVYSNFLELASRNSNLKDTSHVSSFKFQVSSLYPFPFLTLVASGGHTDLILSKSHAEHILVGATLDDAAGEAFDKAAKMLDLPYPGGPAISKMAESGDDTSYPLPRGMAKNPSYNFSFSGLKTALAQLIAKLRADGVDITTITPDLAASFQSSVVDSLVQKTMAAARHYQVRQLNLAGGVAANVALRTALQKKAEQESILFHVPKFAYCTDNAAMVGAAAHASVLASRLRASAMVGASRLRGDAMVGAAGYASTLVKNSFPWYDVGVKRNPELAL